MKKQIIWLFLFFIPIALFSQNRIYVNIVAEGANNGSSWYDAYTTIEDAYTNAISFKSVHPTDTLEIWVAFGTYSKAVTRPNDTAFYMLSGVHFFGGFTGRETSIEERDYTLGYTILDGGDSCRILVGDIPLTSSAGIFNGFKFINGNSTNFTDQNGAGIVLKGNAYLINCWIENCKGNNAVYIDNSSYSPSSYLTNLSNVYIENNSCTGVYAASNYSQIDNCTISHNTTTNGYGIYISGSNGFINECTIADNTATGFSINNGKILKSCIRNNTLRGGIATNTTIINTIIANNDQYGIESTNSNIINCNIINNGSSTLTAAGGVKSVNDKYYNTIFWNNVDSAGQKSFYTKNGTTISHCASSDTLSGTSNILLSSSNIGTQDDINYPTFLSVSEGVGSAYTFTNLHTQSYSVFVNAGTTPPVTMPSVDYDNNTRIYDENENSQSSDDQIDIGVYEFQHTLFPAEIEHNIIYVTEEGSGKKDGSSWNNALSSLIEAISLAHRLSIKNSAIYSIWVAAGTYQEDDMTYDNSIYPIYPNINIYGSFTGTEAYNYDLSQRNFKINASKLDGNNNKRIFIQYRTFVEGESAIIDGFIVQNGYVKETSTQNASGAGIFLYNYVKIANCLIQNNISDGYSAMAQGTGLYLTGADTITHCIIYNNKSYYQVGGIYAGSGSIISNCIISNNQASEGFSALYSINSIIENSTIVNNLSINGSTVVLILSNSIFRNNIVWGNICYNSKIFYADNTANIIENCAIQGYSTGNTNLIIASSNDGEDAGYQYPRFISPSNEAGNIKAEFFGIYNYSLKSTSDLIDKGSNSLYYANTGDLALKARITGTNIDLGAYELPEVPLTKGGIVYVTTEGTGDGSSWNYALSDINFATKTVSRFNIDSADTESEKVKIWIKKGIYYGDSIACNPAFLMQPKVDVYGSFVGNEPANYDETLRHYKNNATILDGQNVQRVLLQDGDVIEKPSSTIWYFGYLPDSTATWDGFVIRKGYTDCDNERVNSTSYIYRGKFRNRGAGVYLQNNGFLNNCQILNNETTMKSSYSDEVTLYEGWGAGVFLSGKSVLYNCEIRGNKGASRCGGVYIDHSSTLLNCLICNNESYNVSTRGGAGLYCYNSRIYNTTVVRNKLKQYSASSYAKGGGVFLNVKSGTKTDSSFLYNSVIWGNVFEYKNGTVVKSQIEALNGAPNIYIKYCAIDGYTTAYSNTHCSDIDVLASENYGLNSSLKYPQFVFPTDSVGVFEGISYSDTYNWTVLSTSPLINKGSLELYPDSANYPQDIVGNPRILEGVIDIGSYEYTYLHSKISSDTIYVTQSGCGNGTSWHDAFGDFQVAIDTAFARNQRYGENKVSVWVAGGEYYGNFTDSSAITMRNGVNVYGGFYGYQESSLDERDPETYPTYLKGNNMHRVLYQAEDFTDSTIWDGFIITEGKVENGNGGGAYLRANAVLQNCIVTGNVSTNGMGGGIFGKDGALIYNTTFTDNSAKNGSAAYLDSATISRCIFTHNMATDSDGFTIIAKSHSTLVDSAVVLYNIGGGIDAYDGSNTRRTIIAANTGLGARGDNQVIFNNLLINNNGDGGLQLTNNSKSYSNTIVNNVSEDTCAGIILNNSSMINSLVWGNEKDSNSSQILISNHSTVKYSAIQDTLLNFTSPNIDTVESNLKFEADNIGNEGGKYYPFFTSPCKYKGVVTSNYITRSRWGLQPNSSCYNKGSMVLQYTAEEKDLNGNMRIDFGRIDIGAYELQWPRIYLYKTVFVSEGGRGNQTGVTWEHAMPYIQEAIEIAEVTGYPIWVSKGNYYGDTLDDAAFLVKSGVKIYGSFVGNEETNYNLLQRDLTANASILYGQNKQRVINQPAEIADTAIFDGFTIMNGYSSTHGAGAYLINNVILKYCNFNNNNADGNGGALYSEKQNEIYYSYFQNNGGNQGGAIYGDSLIMKNNIIANNESQAEGGGLYLKNSSLLINNTIVRNLSRTDGGGIYSKATDKYNTFINNILWANKSIGISDTMYNQIRLAPVDTTHFTYNAVLHFDSTRFTGQHNIYVEEANREFNLFKKYIAFYLDNEITGRTSAFAVWNPVVGSAVLDKGDITAQAGAYDINNHVRINGSTIDMGAIENQSINYNYEIIYVKNNDILVPDGKSWDDALHSIMDAVILAYVNIDTNTGKHPLVWVAQGTYTGDITSTAAFLMLEDVQVTGGFVGNEAPDYDVSQLRRSGTLLQSAQSDQRILEQISDFDSLTFWRNFRINKADFAGDGAGVYLKKNGGLDNWLIYNATAKGDTTKGGGVYAEDSAIIKRIRTENCTATYGGGIYLNNSALFSASLYNNTASKCGGGVYAENSYIVNTYIHYNKGGGIVALDSTHLVNNTIVRNKITSSAGIISTGSGVICTDSTTILNCLIWGNVRNNSDSSNQITKGVANVSYSAIQRDSIRGGQNGNLLLETDNVNTTFDVTKYYPEITLQENLLPLTTFSSAIDAGAPTLPTLPDYIDFSLDAHYHSRVFNQRIDMGANEFQNYIKIKSCKDSICQQNSIYTFLCGNKDINISAADVNKVGTHYYRDTTNVSDTVNIYYYTLKVKPKPTSTIAVSDEFISNISSLSDCISGTYSGTLFWSVDSGLTFASTMPDTNVQKFYVYEERDNMSSCHTDTLSFLIYKECNVNFSEDTVKLCMGEVKSLTYFGDAADYAWTMDSTIAVYDNVNKILTPVAVGNCIIAATATTCISDTVVVIIAEKPKIEQDNFTITDSYSGSLLPTLENVISGTWIGSYPGFVLNGSTGEITVSSPAIGIYPFYFMSDGGCSDTVTVIVGSSNCSFTISDATQLGAFRDAVNSGSSFTKNGITYDGAAGFSGCSISLSKNIDFAGETWTPIGTSTHPFRGSFSNGGSYNAISRFKINASSTDNVGFFGYIEGATISGIRFTCDTLNLKIGYVIGNNNVGGIVGYAKNSAIIKCSSTLPVTGNTNVGAIVGLSDGTNISQCMNSGTVHAYSGPVGGIVGNTNAKVEDCMNAGWIYTNNADSYVGGICGSSSDTVQYAVNVGVIGMVPRIDISHIGNIAGLTFSSTVFYKTYYDKQMTPCDFQANDLATILSSSGLLTKNITGFLLQDSLNTHSFWHFATNLYPTPATFNGAGVQELAESVLLLDDSFTTDNINQPAKLFSTSSKNINWHSISINPITQTNSLVTFASSGTSDGQSIIKDTLYRSCSDKDTTTALLIRRAKNESAFQATRTIPIYLTSTQVRITPFSDNILYYNGEDTVKSCYLYPMNLLATPSNYNENYTWENSKYSYVFTNADSIISIDVFRLPHIGWWTVTLDHPICGISKDSIYAIGQPIQTAPSVSVYNILNGTTTLLTTFPTRIISNDLTSDSLIFVHPISGNNVEDGCQLEYRVVTENDDVIYDWTTWTDTSEAIKYKLRNLWHGIIIWQLRHKDCSNSCGNPIIYSASIEIINSKLYFEPHPEYANICPNVDSVWVENVICQNFRSTDSSIIYGMVFYIRGEDTLYSFKSAQTSQYQILDTATHAAFPNIIGENNTSLMLKKNKKHSTQTTPNGIPLQTGDRIVILGYYLDYNTTDGSTIDYSSYTSSDSIHFEWQKISSPKFIDDDNLKDYTICYNKLLHSIAWWKASVPDTLLTYMDTAYWYFSTDNNATYTRLDIIGTDSVIDGRFKVRRTLGTPDEHGLDLRVYDVVNGISKLDTLFFMVEAHWFLSCEPTRDTIMLIVYPQVTAGTISGTPIVCSLEEIDTLRSVTDGTLTPDIFNYLWQHKTESENIFYTAPGRNDTTYYISSPIENNTLFRRVLYNGTCGYYYSDTVMIQSHRLHYSDTLFTVCQGSSITIPEWGTLNPDTMEIGKLLTKTSSYTCAFGCDSIINTHVVVLRSNTSPLTLMAENSVVCKNSSTFLTLHNSDSADLIKWYDGTSLIASGNDTILEIFPDSTSSYTAVAIYNTEWTNPLSNNFGDRVTSVDISIGDIITKNNIILSVDDWTAYKALGYDKDDILGVVFQSNDSTISIYNIKDSYYKIPWGYDLLDSIGVLIPNIPLYSTNSYNDLNGAQNTEEIILYNIDNDMMWNANNCAAKWVKDSLGHDWHLPAAGELVVDNSQLLLLITSFNTVTGSFHYIDENSAVWTSTQNSTNNAWAGRAGVDWMSADKRDSLYVFGAKTIETNKLVKFRNTDQCSNAKNIAITVTNEEVKPGKITAHDTICQGASAPTITSVTAGSGGSGSYQWQYTYSLTHPFMNVSGSGTAADYTPDTLTKTTYFRRAWISTCGTFYSDTSTVLVNPTYFLKYSASICKGNVYNEFGWNINTADSTIGIKNYTQNLTTANGCDSVRILSLNILQPIISVTGPTIVTSGNNATLIANFNTDSIAWYKNGVLIPNSNKDTLVQQITENVVYTAKAILDTTWLGNGDTVKTASDFAYGDIVTKDNMIVKPQYWHEAEAAGKEVYGVIFYNNSFDNKVYLASPIDIPLIYWMNIEKIEKIPNMDYFYEFPESDIYGYENGMAIRAYADTASNTNTAQNNLHLWVRDNIGFEWYLPAAGEIYNLYQAKSNVNMAFDTLNVDTMFHTANKAWTSTEYSASQAWCINKNGVFIVEDKANRYYSRGITQISYNELTLYCNDVVCDAQTTHSITAELSFNILEDTINICSDARDTLHLSRDVSGTWSSSDTNVAKISAIAGFEDSLAIVIPNTISRDTCYIYYTSTYGLVKDSTLIIVKPLPVASFASDTVYTCTGETIDLTPVITPVGINTLSYQWQINNSGTWSNIGTNIATFTTSAINAATDFRVILTGDGCSAVPPYNDITVKNFKQTTSGIKVKNNNILILDE